MPEEGQDILGQADSFLPFKPAEGKLEVTAKAIDCEKYQLWKKYLKQLRIGECILVGAYRVDGKEVKTSLPLICEVVL